MELKDAMLTSAVFNKGRRGVRTWVEKTVCIYPQICIIMEARVLPPN